MVEDVVSGLVEADEAANVANISPNSASVFNTRIGGKDARRRLP